MFFWRKIRLPFRYWSHLRNYVRVRVTLPLEGSSRPTYSLWDLSYFYIFSAYFFIFLGLRKIRSFPLPGRWNFPSSSFFLALGIKQFRSLPLYISAGTCKNSKLPPRLWDLEKFQASSKNRKKYEKMNEV